MPSLRRPKDLTIWTVLSSSSRVAGTAFDAGDTSGGVDGDNVSAVGGHFDRDGATGAARGAGDDRRPCLEASSLGRGGSVRRCVQPAF
jgi:hypothetical protein